MCRAPGQPHSRPRCHRNPSRPSLRPRASGLYDRPTSHPGMRGYQCYKQKLITRTIGRSQRRVSQVHSGFDAKLDGFAASDPSFLFSTKAVPGWKSIPDGAHLLDLDCWAGMVPLHLRYLLIVHMGRTFPDVLRSWRSNVHYIHWLIRLPRIRIKVGGFYLQRAFLPR